MFRDKETIYVNSQEYKRLPKTSEIVKNLEDEIAHIKFFLNRATFATEQEKVEKRKRLGKLERQLASLMETPRCHKTIKTYKKVSPDKIRVYTLQQIEEAKKNNVIYISADDIAFELRVKPHFVAQVFQQLNVEGILSQSRHYAPHDSNRDPLCGGTYAGWQSSLYAIHYN